MYGSGLAKIFKRRLIWSHYFYYYEEHRGQHHHRADLYLGIENQINFNVCFGTFVLRKSKQTEKLFNALKLRRKDFFDRSTHLKFCTNVNRSPCHKQWGATIAKWFVYTFHPAAPGGSTPLMLYAIYIWIFSWGKDENKHK